MYKDEKCTPEKCNNCALEFWCDKQQLEQKSNLEKLIGRVKSFCNPNFVVV